ncbi:MAG TPA: hypothetical protein VD836_16870 [Solirubrobacteraceae bacterium]|nr:hypothetical protein [Solirubrobacteraceae bacterium]
MPSITALRRLGAAVLTAAALAGAAASPASADQSASVCDTRLDRLEAQFYAMADRRSYEDASDWWSARWAAYHTSCVV